jgi:hypothetical protein
VRRDLLRWQWEGYPEFHKDRANLLAQVVAVPGFGLAAIAFALSLATLRFGPALAAFLLMITNFGVQGAGHKREACPPIPFDGPLDAVTRILAEQFVTFPRFVLSGRLREALRRAS